MSALAAFPATPVVFLNANNVDGDNNSFLSHGDDVIAWRNQGSTGVDFLTDASEVEFPYLKKGDTEQSVAHDGVRNILTSLASQTALAFIHRTGIFDLVLCIRRSSGGPTDSRGVFGGHNGGRGLQVSLASAVLGLGQVRVSMNGGNGTLTDFTTTFPTPVGQPVKILIRGDGTRLRVSRNFYQFQSQTFQNALNASDAVAEYDYCIGAGYPTGTSGRTFGGDTFMLGLWNRNLTLAELVQTRDALEAQVGVGV